MTRVSVIIPVYGAAAGLEACLACLAAQTFTDFEVIVVDNGAPRVGPIVGRDPRARLVREPRPGSYAARNAGVAVARGEIFAFTDDDCLPAPDWLERAVAIFDGDPNTSVMSGPIQMVKPRPSWVSPTAYLYLAMVTFTRRGTGGFGATANLLVRRAAFTTIGGFEATQFSGADMDFGWRALAAGFPTRFAREVCVGHQPRRSVVSVLRRELRLAGGNQVNRERSGPPGHRRILREIYAIEVRGKLTEWLYLIKSPELRVSADLRVRLSALALVAQLLRAGERLRVHFGGTPRRA